MLSLSEESGTIDLLRTAILAVKVRGMSRVGNANYRVLQRLGRWLDLFLETKCPLCHRSTGAELCRDCQRQVQQCQFSSQEQGIQEQIPLFSWGCYGGALKQSIAALKYNHHPQVARPLGDWLGQAWMSSGVVRDGCNFGRSSRLVVVPIPMHADKLKQRGFNQADLLAEAFCQRTGLPLKRQGLVRVRATEAQFSLSPEAREKNLSQAFRVGQELLTSPGKAVLLLDDIYTTGATARAAVQALQQQQISVRAIVTVARAG